MDLEMKTLAKDTEALIQAIRALNKALKDPEKLDEELLEILKVMEKGVAEKPRKPSNA